MPARENQSLTPEQAKVLRIGAEIVRSSYSGPDELAVMGSHMAAHGGEAIIEGLMNLSKLLMMDVARAANRERFLLFDDLLARLAEEEQGRPAYPATTTDRASHAASITWPSRATPMCFGPG